MSQESPGVEARLQLEIHEDLEAFHEAAERLRLFLEERDVEESTRYSVELIAEELATNVVKYGFRDEAHRVLHLSVELRGERALLAFTDDGAAFDPTAPRAIASPGHLSEARAG